MIDRELNKIFCGDCLEILNDTPSNFVDLVITSPPYFQQRDYGGTGIGNEKTIEEYIDNLTKVFRECVRVTKKTGSIVFNLGDKYIDGSLLLVPYRFAIEVLKEKQVKLVVVWEGGLEELYPILEQKYKLKATVGKVSIYQ